MYIKTFLQIENGEINSAAMSAFVKQLLVWIHFQWRKTLIW